MFRRRVPRTKFQQLREFFWPSMGILRWCRYIKHRVVRLSDTSHKIAAGLACGAAISFTPIVGTHFIQAGILAYILRANLLASLIGTFVGNPWTFPFMWWLAIEFGGVIFNALGLPSSTSLPQNIDFAVFWDIVRHHPMRIFLPWAAGGYLIALLSWPLWYLMFFNMVKGAKLARKKARLRKVHKVAKELTGQKK